MRNPRCGRAAEPGVAAAAVGRGWQDLLAELQGGAHIRSLDRVLFCFVVALVATAAAAASPSGTRATGCPAAPRYPAGDPRNVYPVPGGCVWIARPSSTLAGFGPIVMVRTKTKVRREPLGREPFGDAAGFCGVSALYASGRYLTITASKAWLGQTTGCQRIAGGEMIWFEYLRPDGYLHQLATSAPWRHP